MRGDVPPAESYKSGDGSLSGRLQSGRIRIKHSKAERFRRSEEKPEEAERERSTSERERERKHCLPAIRRFEVHRAVCHFVENGKCCTW